MTQPISNMINRRNFLGNTAQGLSGIALASLLSSQGLLAAEKRPLRPEIDPAHPFAARPPHFEARAKNVLMIFCAGACSQLDTFDYKPELIRRHGEPMPGADGLVTFQGKQGNLTKSPWEFRPRGECGKMISDLVPKLGELADEMCFIHSLTGKTNTHGPGENFMSTGFTLDGFPSVGAWVTWAMGTENQELPAYVAIPDPRGTPQSSVNNWGCGFLPAAFQGTDFNATKPLRNLERPSSIDAATDEATREFLQRMNRRHMENFPGDSELAARISSYELAARMQLSVPSVTDLSTESAATLSMYGADDAFEQFESQLRAELHSSAAIGGKRCAIRTVVQRRVSNWRRRCQQLGRAQATSGAIQQTRSGARSTNGRTASRLEATWTAERHFSRLVYRVWTHANISSWRERTRS